MASCGGRRRNQSCQRRSRAATAGSGPASCASGLDASNAASNQSSQLRRPEVAASPSPLVGACAAACTPSAMVVRWYSSSPNRGERSARASDRSCRGETSASTSATTSCTSGASASFDLSASSAWIPWSARACCMAASVSFLRASTRISVAGIPARSHCASQPAAWRHSRRRNCSSGLVCGMVRLLRQEEMPSLLLQSPLSGLSVSLS